MSLNQYKRYKNIRNLAICSDVSKMPSSCYKKFQTHSFSLFYFVLFFLNHLKVSCRYHDSSHLNTSVCINQELVWNFSFLFLVTPHSLRDLSSPKRDQTRPQQWKCWVLTTGPLGNSFENFLNNCQDFFFFFKHLYWSIIALQWCVSFCFITKWISYMSTYIPISLPSCVSLPPTLPIPLL